MRTKNRLSFISTTLMVTKILSSDAAKLRIAPTLNTSGYPASDFIPSASTDHGVATPRFNPLVAELPTHFSPLLLAKSTHFSAICITCDYIVSRPEINVIYRVI